MKLLFYIALKHLLARKRQSIVSLLGIVLGVSFYLAISSMMHGSEDDFMGRLVDNAPHINISDEYRDPRPQPVNKLFTDSAVQVHKVKPQTEIRGIREYQKILEYLASINGLRASPVLFGQGIVNFAGQDTSITVNGMIPSEIDKVSTIRNYITDGSLDDLITNPDGIIIGATMAHDLSLSLHDTLKVATQSGQSRVFKIVGIFKTGRGSYDRSQGFIHLTRAQSLMDKTNRINSILVKLNDPNQALIKAKEIEERIGYKSQSWQESSNDLMNAIAIRNKIMFTVVSAVLVVAAFGIYNVISTVVMEKQRDISILKSMGFKSFDIKKIFLIQGVLLGVAGNLIGIPLGCAIMHALSYIKFKPPGSNEIISMPLSWGIEQFIIAGAFAICAAVIAAFLPARKAANVKPVDILRGGL